MTKTGCRVHRFSVEFRPVGGSRGISLPEGVLELLKANDKVVCVIFKCPCGCGSLIRLWTNNVKGKEVLTNWGFKIDTKNQVSLYSAVKPDEGCGAHFYIVNNNVTFKDRK